MIDFYLTRRSLRVSAALAASAAVGLMTAPAALAGTPGNIVPFAGGGMTNPSTTPIAADDAALQQPAAVATDAQGDVYIADISSNEVTEVTPTGQLTVIAGGGATLSSTNPIAPLSAQISAPNGVAVAPGGSLFISASIGDEIDQIDASDQLTLFAGNHNSGTPVAGPATDSPLQEPTGVAVAPDGDVYFAEPNGGELMQVTPDGTLSIFAGGGNATPSTTPALATSVALNQPNGVAVDAAGNVYVDETNNDLVEKIDPSGMLSVIAGGGNDSPTTTPAPATSVYVSLPEGLTVDSAGDLFVAMQGQTNQIAEITPDGNLAVVAGNGGYSPTYGGAALDSGLSGPSDIAVDAAGDLFIAEEYGQGVDEVFGPAPGNVDLPVISGSASVGDVLSTGTGTWSPTPTAYAYDWQRCDASGANCSDVSGADASTYTATTVDVGHTLRVIVTGSTPNGSATATSAISTIVTAARSVPTTTITVPTTTTTTTTTTPPGAAASANGVSLSARTLSTGLTVTGTGTVQLPLVCPQTAGGCDADGDLTLGLTGRHANAVTTDAIATSSVIAQFAGIEITAGHSRLVVVRLSPAATRYLQTRGIRRVKVTLTTHNHLSGGPTVTTVQQLWLRIGPLLASCPSASGTLTASHIGTMGLGLTRAQAHRLGRYRKTQNGLERYCLTGGKIRVAYPSLSLTRRLTGAQRHRVAGRVIFALTANRHYAIRGVHTQMSLRAARARLTLGRPLVIGRNAWYVVQGRRATWVVKSQRGVIREIGIAQRFLARTRGEQAFLLHHL